MKAFHFYLKMSTKQFSEKYERYPEKYYPKEINDKKSKKRKNNNIYIPFCICLISKYRYEKQMETCLQSIYKLLTNNKEDEKENCILNNLNYFIIYLINSNPIPDVESNVVFIFHTIIGLDYHTLN